MQNGNILIVDDNKSVLTALEFLLTSERYNVRCLSNPNLILSTLKESLFDVVLLDMNFSAGINTGNEGIYWLRQINKNFPELSVVMITAYGDVELAVSALKSGASDFILKPWDNTKLKATVHSAMQLSRSRKEIKTLRTESREIKRNSNPTESRIIGTSPELIKVLKLVQKVAKTDTNILITGENGTGKELIAREIHRLSKRSNELMISVDMGAVSETLFESELFGHVKGAFTDAKETRTGKFELAGKGSLFLDEIGNLPLHLQSKLLAVLQNREVCKIGSNEPVAVDIRLICATNKNPDQMVLDGIFREDLLYRINTIQVEIPPLRQRGNDIILLGNYFLDKYTRKYDKPPIRLNSEAQEKIMSHNWPGNVRELEHTMEKAVILSDGRVLKAEDFYFRNNQTQNLISDNLNLEDMESRMIRMALEKNPGNISSAAEELGITRQTLYNKMKKLGIR